MPSSVPIQPEAPASSSASSLWGPESGAFPGDDAYGYLEAVLDAAGAPVDFIYKDVSPALLALGGRAAEEVLGRRYSEVRCLLDFAYGFRVAREVYLEGRPFVETHALALPHGPEVRRIRVIRAPKGVHVIAEDLREQQRTEQDLEDHRQRLAMIVASVSDLILELDEKGRLRYASPAWTRIVGQGLRGPYSLLERLSEGDQAALLAALAPRGDPGVEWKESLGELPFSLGEGHARTLDCVLVSMPSPDGGRRLFFFGRDVTADKLAKELKLGRERARVAADLAAELAEQIRDPLAVIAMNLDLLPSSPLEDPKFAARRQALARAVDRVNDLVNGALRAARRAT